MEILKAASSMDWQQVVLNGGPPCFHLEKDGSFCGRAERWHEDQNFHKFKSLHDLLFTALARVASLEAELKLLADTAAAVVERRNAKDLEFIAMEKELAELRAKLK